MRVVDFASSARQSIIRKEQRVGLARLDCGDGNVVGLLFTRGELDAFIQLRFHDKSFSDSFIDSIFDMTRACEREVKNPFILSD